MAAQELINTPLYTDGNIVAYYQMENANATLGGQNLTTNGTVTYTAAKFNNGANFSAFNNLNALDVASNLGISSGATTISLWVKVLNEPTANQSYRLVNLRTTSGGTNYIDWQIRYDSDASNNKTLYFDRSKPGIADQGPIYSVTLGTSAFHHIAFTYDGTNIHGYLDGTDVTGASAASGVGNGGADHLYVAAAGIITFPASVIIDDLAFFTRALSATEVSNLYNGFPSTTFSGAMMMMGV